MKLQNSSCLFLLIFFSAARAMEVPSYDSIASLTEKAARAVVRSRNITTVAQFKELCKTVVRCGKEKRTLPYSLRPLLVYKIVAMGVNNNSIDFENAWQLIDRYAFDERGLKAFMFTTFHVQNFLTPAAQQYAQFIKENPTAQIDLVGWCNEKRKALLDEFTDCCAPDAEEFEEEYSPKDLFLTDFFEMWLYDFIGDWFADPATSVQTPLSFMDRVDDDYEKLISFLLFVEQKPTLECVRMCLLHADVPLIQQVLQAGAPREQAEGKIYDQPLWQAIQLRQKHLILMMLSAGASLCMRFKIDNDVDDDFTGTALKTIPEYLEYKASRGCGWAVEEKKLLDECLSDANLRRNCLQEQSNKRRKIEEVSHEAKK